MDVGISLSVVYLNLWVLQVIGLIKHLMVFVLFGQTNEINSVRVSDHSKQARVLQILLTLIVRTLRTLERQHWMNLLD